MSFWDYALPVAGGVGGFFLGGPAGAVAGVGGGTIAAKGIDSATSSTPSAPGAPAPVTAPTLNPNAGIGSGFGNASPEEQNLQSQAQGLQNQQDANDQAWKDAKASADVALMNYQWALKHGDSAGAQMWGQKYKDDTAQMDKMAPSHNATSSQLRDIKGQLGNLATDPNRFASEARASYNRPAPQATLVTPDRGQVLGDIATQGQARNDEGQSIAGMQSLADRLNNDLTGKAPSLAQAQLANATEQNLAAQRSMAATAGPMDYAATARAAVMGGAAAQQQSIRDAALLRAQEYASSEGLLGQTTQNIAQANVAKRAQDLQNLGMSYQDAMARASFEAQQGQFNVSQQQQQNALNQGREGMYLSAYQGTRQMQNQNAIAQLNAQVATNSANSGAGAANYATGMNSYYQSKALSDQQSREFQNALATGGAAYAASQPKPGAAGGGTPAPSAPTLNNNYNPDWGNNQNGYV